MVGASARLSLLRVLPAVAVTMLGLVLGLGPGDDASAPGAALAVLLLLAVVTGLAKTSSA